jgi:CheY-like chemotaxis protein
MDNQKKKSILIIDDEKSNLTVLTDILHDEYNLYVFYLISLCRKWTATKRFQS